jgi:deoxycytidylate deaminase
MVKAATRKRTESKVEGNTLGRQGSVGINLENVAPVLPPDNEHTGKGMIAHADACAELARAIHATAQALQELARHHKRAGVYIGNCTISDLS